MRLNRSIIEYLGETLGERLVKNRDLDIPEEYKDQIKRIIVNVITDNVEKERQIEEEAHKILKQHIREIESQGVSYHKMFQIVKQKLAKERGVVL